MARHIGHEWAIWLTITGTLQLVTPPQNDTYGAAADTPLLHAHDLHYRYPGAISALNGLELAIYAGRRLAILGPNGAGKTTLLLHLNGVLQPCAGQVFLHGQPQHYHAAALAHWRTQVGVVLQDPDDQLFAATVYEDVSFGPMNLRLPIPEVQQRVQAALAALQISDLAERPTHRLSFGQKKRVAIAGVLAMRPQVLILDEPSAGLDPHAVEQLYSVLTQLHAQGTTLVLSTHDVDLAYRWADEVAIFHSGHVLAQGAVTDVLGNAPLLQQAQLRVPTLLALAQQLRPWLPSAEFPPREYSALLTALQQRLRNPQVSDLC